jgi:hypothetical protein
MAVKHLPIPTEEREAAWRQAGADDQAAVV